MTVPRYYIFWAFPGSISTLIQKLDLDVHPPLCCSSMKIYKFILRVPGGMMVVPLFIGMVINTFFPNLLKIGGFTQALTGVGYPTILGMYLFTVGTKIAVGTASKILLRGFGIMAAKVGTATVLALAVAHLFGGSVIGLSTLAIMVAMSDTNGGM